MTPPTCLHHLFEAQALATPDHPAVRFEGERLTYAELNRRADLLAAHLRSMGAVPDARIGLLVDRSADAIVGILGTLKAGAAYVPIDPAYPADRTAGILADSGATLLLTQEPLLAKAAGHPGIVCLDRFDWTALAPPAAGDVRPEHLAYVIYTSGSTGKPKGVCIEHRNIVSYTQSVSERLRLEPGMQHATVSTFAADLGNTVVFSALVTGGCLHVIAQDRLESQARLSEYFQRERIDVLKIVPSHLAALQTGRDPERVMPRRRLILGGEASRLDWIAQLRALAPGCEIFNHYGPTETTVGVVTYRVDDALPSTTSGTLPLGLPLANSRVYVVDVAGSPVQAGAEGELCIGGDGVGRGYLNRPDLTAEKFVADPFEAGGRMYRTGDRARLLATGDLEFLGRIDHQVKINGYRVELGEIESALREQGGVRDTVVVAADDGAGHRQLVAYIVPTRARQPLWDAPSVHVLPDGAPVAHLNRNETDYIYNEIFTLQAYLRHGITIEDGDCILDAGSNIGLFTVFANRIARDLRMISFEPNPAACGCVSANAAAYGPGVTVLKCGVSSENKTAELTFFEGMSLLSGFYADARKERDVVKNYVFNQDAASGQDARMAAEMSELIEGRFHERKETAQLRTLASVMADHGINRVDLLKINVEKSELDVLRGLSDTDWPRIRQMVIEVDLDENIAPITALLERHGYDVLVEQDPLLRKTELCYVYAVRPEPGRRGLVRDQAIDAHLRTLPPPDPEVLTPVTLRRFLRNRLPAYMVPAAFVPMEKLPLNANGKIDRQALPAVSVAAARVATPVSRPLTPTEKALAGIWQELLHSSHVDAEDNFFELGGHSLLAIKTVSRIRDVFDVDVQLRNLFERPTLSGLAEIVDGLSWMRPTSEPDSDVKREEIEL